MNKQNHDKMMSKFKKISK